MASSKLEWIRVRFIDPDGLRWAQIAVDGGLAYRWFDDNEKG